MGLLLVKINIYENRKFPLHWLHTREALTVYTKHKFGQKKLLSSILRPALFITAILTKQQLLYRCNAKNYK